MGKPWIRNPVTPPNDRWMIFSFIAPLAILAFITIFFPSLSITDAIASVVCHPVFVSLLWIFWLWQILRQWQKVKKAKTDN
jgi:protein-S-isoprenylcysteine O-methyltransferase Ste14